MNSLSMKLSPCCAAALGLLGWLSPDAPAQEIPQQKVIRKISIQGLQRLSEPTVLAKMKIRIGQVYDERAVSEETGLLFKMGEFSRVEDPKWRYYEDGVEVIYVVVEKRRIASIKFKVLDSPSGKPSVSQSTLRDEISSKPDGKFGDYSLQADAEKIRRIYREKGYAFAEVKTQTREEPAGTEVAFLIEEGTRVRIHEIEFLGNRSIPSGDLQAILETKVKDFFFGLINPGYYDEAILARDIGRIMNYYRGKGFFEVRATVDEIVFDAEMRRLKIAIRVEEGPRWTFRGYRFEGNRIFSTAVLAPLARASAGQPFDEERMQEDRGEILKYYRDRAYIDAKVDPEYEYSAEGTDVWIRFKIEEGSEISIEHVHIRKNEKTQDRVIRRELEFFPGEKVNYSKIEKSKSNLARLQIFKDVKIAFEKGSAKGMNNVAVQVDEEPTGRLILGFGVTSGYGIIGNLTIHKRNFDPLDTPASIFDVTDAFTGAGQTLNIAIQPGTQRSLYRVTFIEPYLFDTRNSLTLAGAILTIIRHDYDEGRMSFTPRIGHAFDFDRDLVFSVGARIEQVKISDIDDNAAPDVYAVEGYTSIAALNAALSFDKVLEDRWEGPYQGHRELLTYEYGGGPLGGEVDFQKVEFSLSLYFPLYVHEEDQLHHVIGLYSKAGFIEPHSSTTDIPIFERFFLGGPNTVRGFDFRGLGPHFKGDALGGTAAWYGNVEYVFPILQKFLRGVIWFDYGNLAPDLETFTLEEMRYAAGGGIRVNFPFLGGAPLPIGLYLGYPIQREDPDKPRTFLFTIGLPF